MELKYYGKPWMQAFKAAFLLYWVLFWYCRFRAQFIH
jgi:hypothetical protein